MEKEFVTYKGKKYYVGGGGIELNGLRLTEITEIEGLVHLIYLYWLNLEENEIKEINGLEHLIYLRILPENKVFQRVSGRIAKTDDRHASPRFRQY